MDGEFEVRWSASPRADELAATEEEHHYSRVLEAANEPWELLRFGLNVVETQSDRDRVEVDLVAQVGGCDDVLNLNLRMLQKSLWPVLANQVRDLSDGLVHLPPTLPARANDLPGAEKENRGLRVQQPIDEAGELSRSGLRTREAPWRSIAGQAHRPETWKPLRSRFEFGS